MNMKGSLTFFFNETGAGQLSVVQTISAEKSAVILSERAWLAALYPGVPTSSDAYLTYASRLKPLIKSYAQNILSVGTNVVMDFPAFTRKQRRWFLELASEINADHELIYIRAGHGSHNRMNPWLFDTPDFSEAETFQQIFHSERPYSEPPDAGEGLVIREIMIG